MATNCLIGVMHGDNFKMIYCHHDGYLEGVGATLLKHYDSPLANNLVALGNLSMLGNSIHPTENSKHCFDTPESGVCVFYKRDRKELDTEFETICSEIEFNEYIADFAYTYLMINEQWYVIQLDETFADKQLLSTVLTEECVA
jgi:hypothetical protein